MVSHGDMLTGLKQIFQVCQAERPKMSVKLILVHLNDSPPTFLTLIISPKQKNSCLKEKKQLKKLSNPVLTSTRVSICVIQILENNFHAKYLFITNLNGIIFIFEVNKAKALGFSKLVRRKKN